MAVAGDFFVVVLCELGDFAGGGVCAPEVAAAAKNARAMLAAALAALFAFVARLRGIIFDFSPIDWASRLALNPHPLKTKGAAPGRARARS